MKKIYVLVMVAIMTLGMSFNAQAIENPWNKGQAVGNLHFGVFPGIGGNLSVDVVAVNSWWKGHFTVGGYVGFNQYTDKIGNINYNYPHYIFSPRATYGLNITDRFEVHAGLMMGCCYGYQYWNDPHSGTYNENGFVDFVYAPVAGIHFFISKNFGLSAEVCYSNYVSYLNAGLTFKF